MLGRNVKLGNDNVNDLICEGFIGVIRGQVADKSFPMSQVSLVRCRGGFFPFLKKYTVVVFGDRGVDDGEDAIVEGLHGVQQFDSFRKHRMRKG